MGSRLCCLRPFQTSPGADGKRKTEERQSNGDGRYTGDPTGTSNKPTVVTAQAVQALIDEGLGLLLTCLYYRVLLR